MNYNTMVAIPLTQYYAFVSDVGQMTPESQEPTATILSKALVRLAKAHPEAWRELSLRDKRRLRAREKDCAIMAVGYDCVDELTCLARVDPKETSMVARALLSDYFELDKDVKLQLLKA